MNTTHTIQVKRENIGLKFLVGVGGLFLLWQLRSYFIADNFSLFQPEPEEGQLGSTSLLVLKVVFDAVIFFGGVLLAVLTGIWAVVWDLIQAARIFLQEWQSTKLAEAEATNAAAIEAGQAAGEVAGQAAIDQATPKQVDPEKLNRFLKKLDKRLTALENAKPVEVVLSETEEREDWREAFADTQAMFQDLLRRLDAPEETSEAETQG